MYPRLKILLHIRLTGEALGEECLIIGTATQRPLEIEDDSEDSDQGIPRPSILDQHAYELLSVDIENERAIPIAMCCLIVPTRIARRKFIIIQNLLLSFLQPFHLRFSPPIPLVILRSSYFLVVHTLILFLKGLTGLPVAAIFAFSVCFVLYTPFVILVSL
jgi:hypothetical protein